MKSNLHTHTTFCDGKSTVEENVLSAIDKGFCSLGFSGHGYTPIGNYCMKDTEGYINEVCRVREKYKDKIQVYLGVEEDMVHFADRSRYNYIIGSNHYFDIHGELYDADGSAEETKKCIDLLNGNILELAENYYRRYCDYILSRKPDVIAHFDLLTKFDEKVDVPFFSDNKEYKAIAGKYLLYAMKSDCIFEVNTGAISRGYRKTPYPSKELLYVLLKNDGKIMLNSDCHHADNLDCAFDETISLLKNIGFKYTYMLYDGKFNKVEL